ncbi:MAG: 3-ketoacyl-ACP reductase [Rhodobacteraceae bacterium]|mgnify:CR=1 FL=1|jgi:3-oxoacyl-[acyl-carrier protein] reductase|nr:3-ketoacyl-ACP reductase [Paracoccaceae bacterium]
MSQSESPIAFVTGGRSGIGRGIAWALADNGFDVVVNDIADDAEAAAAIEGIKERGQRAAFVKGDVADLDAQAEIVETAWNTFGRIDTLVNNAGVGAMVRGDLLDVSVESYNRCLNVNLRSHFFMTQKIAKRMIAAPSNHYRSIICISSSGAKIASILRGEYCISKAGMTMLSQLFATRLAEEGIAVHEIRPGLIRTNMTSAPAVVARYDDMMAKGFTPINRWGMPEEVGRSVATLAKGAFGFSTGGHFDIDGGMHMHLL